MCVRVCVGLTIRGSSGDVPVEKRLKSADMGRGRDLTEECE